MADSTFENEARRQGRVVRNRHLLVAGPLLVLIALSVSSLFFIPIKARLWAAYIFLAVICASFICWSRFIRRLYPELPTVRCPTCGGVARVKEPYGPDKDFYLVCSRCGQRANTKFGCRHSIYVSGE